MEIGNSLKVWSLPIYFVADFAVWRRWVFRSSNVNALEISSCPGQRKTFQSNGTSLCNEIKGWTNVFFFYLNLNQVKTLNINGYRMHSRTLNNICVKSFVEFVILSTNWTNLMKMNKINEFTLHLNGRWHLTEYFSCTAINGATILLTERCVYLSFWWIAIFTFFFQQFLVGAFVHLSIVM